jgi:D-alanyl-D-alanine endopeptidase (penicillin-binding protein 7)
LYLLKIKKKYKLKKTIIFSLLALSACIASAQPELTAQAWLVTDFTGRILEGKHTTDIRPIASITKLMTVMVVLDSGQSLTEIIPKKLYNKQLTRQTLIDLAIVKSDNTAAKMLCDYYPTGYKACVAAMNEKASTLQMSNSTFSDPTGRLHTNVSTAEDLIKLVAAASGYVTITEASNKDVISWPISKKKRADFRNTNSLVGKGYHFFVSKTGFINKSGGCIVMMLDTIYGIRTVILLGSKNTKTRIPEAALISQKVYPNIL